MLENNLCFVRLDIHYEYCKCLACGLVTDAFLPLTRNREHDERCTNVKEQRLRSIASSRCTGAWRCPIDDE